MGRGQRTATASSGAQQSAQAAIALAVGASGGGQLLVRSAAPQGTLWAGYGSITEVETEDGQMLIIKDVVRCTVHAVPCTGDARCPALVVCAGGRCCAGSRFVCNISNIAPPP